MTLKDLVFNELIRLVHLGRPVETEVYLNKYKDIFEPDQVDDSGATALIRCIQGAHAANPNAIKQYQECCQVLAHNNATIDIRDGAGKTALQWAIILKLPILAGELIALGADSELRDERGNTSIHFAIKNDSLECIHPIVEYGPNQVGRFSNTIVILFMVLVTLMTFIIV